MAGVSSEIGSDKAADGVVWSREASHELSLARPSVCMRRRSEFETPCHLHPVHCQHQHLTAAQPHARNSERLGCSSTHVRASSMGDPRINTRWSTMLELSRRRGRETMYQGQRRCRRLIPQPT